MQQSWRDLLQDLRDTWVFWRTRHIRREMRHYPDRSDCACDDCLDAHAFFTVITNPEEKDKQKCANVEGTHTV